MPRQLRDRLRRTAPRQIGGAGDQHLAHPTDPHRLQPRIGERADPHRDVDPFLDDPHIAVDQHHPHHQFAMLGHQRADDGQHMQPPEHHRRGDIELAARFGRGAAQLALGPR
jgi:hypothetical protein